MESENNLLGIDVELPRSVGNMDKKKTKKRKGTKKKVNAMKEVQSIDQVEMKKEIVEVCGGVMGQMDGKLKASDNINDYDGVSTSDHSSTVNVSERNMEKKKSKKQKKTKKKLMNDVQSMDQMDICTETTEQEVNDGLEKNASSEGNTDMKKVKRRKKTKKKVNALNEPQISDLSKMTTEIEIKSHIDDLENSDPLGDRTTVNTELEKNILNVDLTVSSLVKLPTLDVGSIEDASAVNMDKKTIKRRKKIKKKADDMNETESVTQTQMEMNSGVIEDVAEVNDQKIEDYNVVNNESENTLLGEDVSVLSLSGHPNLEIGATGDASEGNMNIEKKKKRKKVKKKPIVGNEVESIAQIEHNLISQIGVNLNVSNNIRESAVVSNESEQSHLGKDSSVLLLADHPEFDAGLTPDACERNMETLNVLNEVQAMDTGSTENLPVSNGKKTRKKKSKKAKDKDEADGKDVSLLPLTRASELAVGSTDNALERNLENVNVQTEVPIMDHVGMITGTTQNLSEIKSSIDVNLEISDQFGECIVVRKESKNNSLNADLTFPSLLEHPKLDVGPTKDASSVDLDKQKIKRRKKIKKNADVVNKTESMTQIEMNLVATEDLAETNDKKIEDCKVVSKVSETSLIGEDITVLSLPEHPKLEIGSTGNISEGSKVMEKKKKRRKVKKKLNVENEIQSMELSEQYSTYTNLSEVKDQVGVSLNASENISEITAVSYDSEKNKLSITNEVQSMEQSEQNLTPTKHAEVKDQIGASDDIGEFTVVSYESEKNDLGKDAILLPLAEHPELDDMLTANASEGNMEMITENLPVSNGENKKRTSHMDKIEDEVQSMNGANGKDVSVLPLFRHPELNAGSAENASEGNIENINVKPEVQTMDQVVMITETTENLDASSVNGKKERKKRRKKKEKNMYETQSMSKASTTNQVAVANGSDEVEGETIVYQGKYSAEGSSSISPIYNTGETMHHSSSYVQQGNYVYHLPPMGLFFIPNPVAPVVTYRRKLLILDINGLLADIVMPAPKDCRGDIHILGRAIFKRPFCDDFLRFCFQNFDVGIWSSRSKKLIDRVVDYSLGHLRSKLFFCWDMTHATQSPFKTLENIHKPLVCKEIRKFWGDDNHRYYWKKGDYDASNTLLIDDSPYKALLNPLHTAIFPRSFSYQDETDNSLGSGGDLRVYLEGLLMSDNVQKYVEQHPFGQSAINENHPSWEFYSRVLASMTQRSNTFSAVRHIHFS